MTSRRRRKKKNRRARESNAAAAQTPVSSLQEPSAAASWGWAQVPLWCLLIVAVLYASSHMNPGVDTWLSLAGGRHILDHGVDDHDPFSSNSRPSWRESGEGSTFHPTGWINQNWLSHALLAAIERSAGPDALVMGKIVLYLLVAVMLVATARSRGAPTAVAIAAAMVGLMAGRDFFEIRAQEMTNFFTCVLLLVLTIGTRGRPRALWLAIPVFALWANFHGGFVFGLIVLLVFVVVEAIAARTLPEYTTVPPEAAKTVAIAGIVVVVASVVLSPYHLSNLTHPMLVTVSADATQWQVVSEWRPLFADGPGDVGWFVGLALATIAVSIVSLKQTAQRRIVAKPKRLDDAQDTRDPSDLWSLVVLVVVCLMAVKSRRFIPMAALVAAPILAERAWMLAPKAMRSFADSSSAGARRFVTVAAWLMLLIAGMVVHRQLGPTFLGPWPASSGSTSVFDRLTHDHRRPEGLCSFLRLNEIEGQVFAPWEEAGYLAACQLPQGGNGDVPVRVFIDARAQEAFPIEALTAYLELRPGESSPAMGPGAAGDPEPAEIARLLRRRSIDLVHEVWQGKDGPLYCAVTASPAWVLVYADDRHELFADRRSPASRGVVKRLRSGALDYPDELSRAITRSANLLESDPARAFEIARETLAQHPSPRLMGILVDSGQSSGQGSALESECRKLVDDLLDNWEIYRGHDGFGRRLLVSGRALQPLFEIAEAEGDDKELRRLERLNSRFRSEMERLNRLIIR